MKLWAWFVASVALVACGGSSTEDGSGGTAGNAGSGGSAGTAGVAGNAGTAGFGGSAGTAGVAGSAGSGGSGGLAPECTSDDECKLFDDCCTCAAYGPNEPPPTPCPAACIQSKCSELGFTGGKARCAAGRCVVGFDCDASKVLCKSLPVCNPGEAPTVQGTCWGPCVPAGECAFVPDCATCAKGQLACVNYDAQTGPTKHCVGLPSSCNGPLCDCLGSSVCLPPYATCSEMSGVVGVGCSCPNC